jgi:lipid A disaccharide synthetase
MLTGFYQVSCWSPRGIDNVRSGTATLETLVTGRPMAVAYRVSAPTAFLLRTLKLVKVRYFSQPVAASQATQ